MAAILDAATVGFGLVLGAGLALVLIYAGVLILAMLAVVLANLMGKRP